MSNESTAKEYYIGEPYQQSMVNLLDEVGIRKPEQHFLYSTAGFYARGGETPRLKDVCIIWRDGTKDLVLKPGCWVTVHPGDTLCNGDRRILFT